MDVESTRVTGGIELRLRNVKQVKDRLKERIACDDILKMAGGDHNRK